MILVKTVHELRKMIDAQRGSGQQAGFVPTMGALHAGHLSLIDTSVNQGLFTICSIFVNPTQFNNPDDFLKYPATLEHDINLLEGAGTHLLFLPDASEIYPAGYIAPHYELGYLETVLEGKYRPGHFQGVCQVVDRLLSFVEPAHLFLGSKDYQQCMVINKLVDDKHPGITVHFCDTIREPDGLAMSSRNMRLNPLQRIKAVEIIRTLREIEQQVHQFSPTQLIAHATDNLTYAGFRVDYVSLSDAATLAPVENWPHQGKVVALVAAYLEDIRLIDNIVFDTSDA
jgi:pantoate--beta-alanine ligase